MNNSLEKTQVNPKLLEFLCLPVPIRLFYRIWDPNGRGTWVQPVFDTDRMTEDQFESAFTALCYKDYEELLEAVPRQITPDPTRDKNGQISNNKF